MNRRLALRREVLSELTDTDLAGVGGAAQSEGSCFGSCLTFVSCYLTDCIADRTLKVDCIAVQSAPCS
jgi:hypothetical protein